jgi:N-acetylglucosaminyldiphosphoundecaprenol N-acetyl-beta-D-mannosaminyltransferase
MTPQRAGHRIELLGMEVDAVTEAEAIGHILGALADGRGGWVATPNLDHLRQFVLSREVAKLYSQADLVVADGMPIVWASKLAGTPLPARAAGSDLIWSLTAEANRRGRSVYFLGGAPGACEKAAEVFCRNYPTLRVAGTHCPPHGFHARRGGLDDIRHRIREATPDIVYVALGFPKQERLIRLLRDEFPRTWFVGVGISFSFVTGEVQRAPDWLQKIGLEWAHRLLKEPRRLARRYLVHDLPFAARLGLYAVMRRLLFAFREPVKAAPPPVRPPRPLPFDSRVVFTHGRFERQRAEVLASLLEQEDAA